MIGVVLNKRYRILKGQSQIDNPQKLATSGTQDEEKENKHITHYVLDTTIHSNKKHK